MTLCRTLFSCLVGLCLFSGCRREAANPPAAAPGSTTAARERKLTVAVIPKGTTHVFWKSVEAGARQAGEELGVEIRWKGPIKENDRAQQIDVVQQFVSEGVDAIVLAPLDDQALLQPCQAAMAKGIPVVIFDSALKGEAGKDFVSFVATDNFKGGKLGGEELVRLLSGQGSVAMLRYQVGSASTEERENGFLEAIRKAPGEMKVLTSNQYGGPTVGDAITVAENMLDHLQKADGVFAPNESTTVGMLTTLQRHNLAGKTRFVGFDASDTLIEGLRKDEIQALVVQNPKKMGYLGVKTAVARAKGEKVEVRVDTGVALITRENLDTPEIQALLK